MDTSLRKPAAITLDLLRFDPARPVALIRLSLHRTWMILVNVTGYNEHDAFKQRLSVLTRRYGELVDVLENADSVVASLAPHGTIHPESCRDWYRPPRSKLQFSLYGQTLATGGKRRTYFTPSLS